MFDVPFDQIAPIVGRTPAASRQLASRARCRVVDAWRAASRSGDFEALVALLAPDVVLRVDGGPQAAALWKHVRGATQVAGQALMFGDGARFARRVSSTEVPGWSPSRAGAWSR